MNSCITHFQVDINKNLVITLNKGHKTELKEIITNKDWNWNTKWYEAIEQQLCNGWTEILPEQVGALTDSPILSESVEYDDNGDVESIGDSWWFPNYMIEDPLETLYKTGQVIFAFAG